MSLGLVIVEVCSRNSVNSEALEKFEEENPEVAVLREECLNNCELCAVRPFAYVNGKTAAALIPEEWMERIKKFAEKEMNMYEDVDGNP